ncbi:MAG: ATP-binding protein [bacterium]|nr:ATP-binding protein [bacterium]
MTAKLVVLSGLPGTGKTEVAESMAAYLKAPVFAKDWLEASLLQSGVVAQEQLGIVGYSLLTTLARRQLALGQSAVLDSVASTSPVRETWRAMALEFDASWFVIECICSDSELHRRRLGQRQRGIPGWPELEWSEVERVQRYFAPWNEERLILDSVNPISENVASAIAYVDSPANRALMRT